MDALDILRDGFGRVAETLPKYLTGLDAGLLLWQPKPDANSIGWLAWHIGRCEDAQVAAIAGVRDVYSQGWVERFDLPYDAKVVATVGCSGPSSVKVWMKPPEALP